MGHNRGVAALIVPRPGERPPAAPFLASRRRPGGWLPGLPMLFRVLVVYVVLYTAPFPLSHVSYSSDWWGWLGPLDPRGTVWFHSPSPWIQEQWRALSLWIWEVVLEREDELFLGPTGSGDTTHQFLLIAARAVLAVPIAWFWGHLASWPRSHARAARGAAAFTSWYVGATMLSYGLAKIIPMQMSPPSLMKLSAPFGDSSPMGLVWSFMGASTPYQMISGWAEAVGGVLLFVRPTRRVGAVLLLAVLGNVVLLNYCYDVPVKLYSSHLWLMTLGVLALDTRRLGLAFFTRRAVPADDPPPTLGARLRGAAVAAVVLGWAWIAYGSQIEQRQESYREWGGGRRQAEIAGVLQVQRQVLDGEPVAPSKDEPERWDEVVIDRVFPAFGRPGSLFVRKLNGSALRLPVHTDEEADRFVLLEGEAASAAPAEGAPAPEGEALTWTLHEPDTDGDGVPEARNLTLRGTFRGRAIEVSGQLKRREDYELVGRGFHWINERPRNR